MSGSRSAWMKPEQDSHPSREIPATQNELSPKAAFLKQPCRPQIHLDVLAACLRGCMGC